LVQVRYVAADGERFAAAAALERLKDSKLLRESARYRCHVSWRTWATMQDRHQRACRAIFADA
jgi:hypothetical protein